MVVKGQDLGQDDNAPELRRFGRLWTRTAFDLGREYKDRETGTIR